MSIAVIQGSSGALGHALAAHVLQNTSLKVYALTHRSGSAASDLKSRLVESTSSKDVENRLTVVDEVDITEESGLERAARLVREREGKGTVRLIACMAGVLYPEKSLSAISPNDALTTFKINTLGHLLTYKHFVPLLPTRKEFTELAKGWASSRSSSSSKSDDDGGAERGDPANGLVGGGNSLCWSMSARVGSIGDNEKGGWYSYRSSKAALNQVIRTLDHELVNRSSSAIAVGYHPGTVLTPFTAPVIGAKAKPDIDKGLLTVQQAIEHMTGVMGKVERGGEEQWGGRCWDWRGKRVEW